MRDSLSEAWRAAGAVADADGRPLHFGDPDGELDAALRGSVLADRSDLARLVATGPDFAELLNRLGTGSVASLAPNQGAQTVLTTPKGRIVERLFVHHLGTDGVLSVGGAGSAGRILEHLKRYTFAEKTGIEDRTAATFLFALVGPKAGDTLSVLAKPLPDPGGVLPARIGGHDVHVLGQDGSSPRGHAVVGSAAAAAEVWNALAERLRPAGNAALESWRVLSGLPASGHELTEDHNPLEAGLWDAVDFDKGCYVGQEVVARLRTYDKVARVLVGLELPPGSPLPTAGTKLFDGAREVGVVTSAAAPPGRPSPVALAYVKRKVLGPRLQPTIGENGPVAVVTELPFPNGAR